MKKNTVLIFSALGLLALFASVGTGCAFDNEEEYYKNLACDTAAVTYSGSVAPIFQSQCNSCHSPDGGETDLSAYAALKTYLDADPGQIPARIRHITGFSPMPLGVPKLPECDIRKIEIWITAGYPNN